MTAQPILANLVWPGLFVNSGLISIWAIILGLIIEWPFIKRTSGVGWGPSFGMTVVINAVSCILGYVVSPLASLAITIPHDFFHMLVNKGGSTFSPSGWIFAYHTVVLSTAFLEYMAFRFFYSKKYYEKRQLDRPPAGKIWFGIWLANLASVAIAFVFIKGH